MTGKALATIEPLPPLATRSLQPLPEWLAELSHSVARVVIGGVKTTRLVTMPTTEQRAAIEHNRRQLVDLLDQTPGLNPEHADAVLFHLGEMMLATPRRADAGALVAEATTRAFMLALEDVPYWATLRAVRNWFRGECESWSDPKGKFAYKWMPAPAELREVAKRYVREVHRRIECFDEILNANRDRTETPGRQHRNEDAVRAIVAGAIKDFDD
jgi:hypothetical protein